MTTDTPVTPRAAPQDLDRGLAVRILRQFKVQVEDWYDVCRHLTAWEDRHLLDNPQSELLAEHARLLDELEKVGRWLQRTTQNSDFPDGAIAELVELTLQDLKDRRALWHGQMSDAERAKTLRAIFNES